MAFPSLAPKTSQHCSLLRITDLEVESTQPTRPVGTLKPREGQRPAQASSRCPALPHSITPSPSAPQGLFRVAAGASVLKRLKQTMASDPRSLEEFCSDPHAVAGA